MIDNYLFPESRFSKNQFELSYQIFVYVNLIPMNQGVCDPLDVGWYSFSHWSLHIRPLLQHQ